MYLCHVGTGCLHGGRARQPSRALAPSMPRSTHSTTTRTVPRNLIIRSCHRLDLQPPATTSTVHSPICTPRPAGRRDSRTSRGASVAVLKVVEQVEAAHLHQPHKVVEANAPVPVLVSLPAHTPSSLRRPSGCAGTAQLLYIQYHGMAGATCSGAGALQWRCCSQHRHDDDWASSHSHGMMCTAANTVQAVQPCNATVAASVVCLRMSRSTSMQETFPNRIHSRTTGLCSGCALAMPFSRC